MSTTGEGAGATNTIEIVRVYWRPGCGFCASLFRALESVDLPLELHNIWDEPDAAAQVRAVANGNETVPTVMVGDEAMVNPSVRDIMATVQRVAPHLIGQGAELDM